MANNGELMLNRLIVMLQIIAIPLYFLYFSIRWRDRLFDFFSVLISRAQWLRPVLPEWMINFLVNAGIVIFFSLPWVLGSILQATRIADSYSLMGRALGKVRIDQKLFYGLNAAFTLIFFVLPFGSPIITIIGIFVVMRLLMIKLKIGKLSKLIWIIPSLILAFYPSLIVFAFYANYSVLIQGILVTWDEIIGVIFGIGLSLAISITLGNFYLFLLEGRAKFEKIEVNEGAVLFLKGIFLGVLLILYFNGGEGFVNIVNYVAVGFAFLELILRRRKDMNEEGSARGIVMVIIFSIVNMSISYLESIGNLAKFFQTIVIVISGLIFFGLFAASYKYATDPDLL